jgi:DNA-binding MarR family transcriptional regulator
VPKNDHGHDDVKPIAELDRVIHEPARLVILTFLYLVDSADLLFLEKQTGLTRGNMGSHLKRLENAGYVGVEKKFVDRIPRTLLHLTDKGRQAFRDYRQQILQVLGTLPG